MNICEELQHLQETQEINVWGAQQELLEQQALNEIEIFASHNQESGVDVEDGEIVDDTATNKPESVLSPLDVNEFIKRQEELKKRREYIKPKQKVTDKSREAAEKASSHQSISVKRKSKDHQKNNTKRRKRETSDSDVSSEGKQLVADANDGSESEYLPSDDSDYDNSNLSKQRRNNTDSHKFVKAKDDGSITCYKARLEQYYTRLEQEKKMLDIRDEEDEGDHVINGQLKIPCSIWNNLYSYQQEGVKWLWNIHQKITGGLLGDEMGLGKTVQIIAFLHALNYSRVVSKHGRYTGLGPTIIVCPATVIHQWVQHFHEWSPEFRVAVLHQSGSYTGNKTKFIKEMNKEKAILLTTYLGVLKYKGVMKELDWHYIILDEGHKIRNPSAKVSIAIKEFHTPHRIMLTGSPMQNNLQELWSLFDFIVPGMLGALPTFIEHFANPIMQGGYMNATPMQEATALSMATALKDMITPYLLRRVKNDVKKLISLPPKSEQVLFCSLTDEQRDLYKGYLLSEHVSMIVGRGGKNWFSQNQMKANMLMAITTLRKICNHPDLYLGEFNENNHIHELDDSIPFEEHFGYYKRSGKMVVVSALLKIWKKQNHRVLLFTQSRAMITVFEEFLQQQGYKYLKMDGSTSVGSRQPLINKFNLDPSYDVFLLTTRVGGLGVNLTGANRVIIYDPDWNPATDTQARERAWRIGQEKEVTIYRLLSAGTIEEKMYQRQVWKQLLSNKVLIDPKTQKFFRSSDLHDLFSLQEQSNTDPETANIFQESRIRMEAKIKEKEETKRNRKHKVKETKVMQFSEDKIQAMKNLAQQIAKSLNSPPKSEPKKSSFQKELEEERQKKLEEKERLKTLTPVELREYNRKKLEVTDDSHINKIDDCDTAISFSKALEVTEKTSKLYHNLNSSKSVGNEGEQYEKLIETVADEKEKKKKKKKGTGSKIDTSGKVDGEVVEGLVKSETKKIKHKDKRNQNESSQNDYVLEKLFNKKGVHTALQHDTIVQGSSSTVNKVKIHYEAQLKTDLALQALRKSRLNSWQW